MLPAELKNTGCHIAISIDNLRSRRFIWLLIRRLGFGARSLGTRPNARKPIGPTDTHCGENGTEKMGRIYFLWLCCASPRLSSLDTRVAANHAN